MSEGTPPVLPALLDESLLALGAYGRQQHDQQQGERGEQQARRIGRDTTVLQYQLMLRAQISPGREWATVSEIAERLQAQLHGVVALVSRGEEAGLVKRKPGTTDRRQVEVHLLAAGRRKLEKLALLHQGQIADLTEVVALVGKTRE